jgi:hypothetical protein
MKSQKWKLANSILIEIEGIKECTDLRGSIALAELMTMDAFKLANLVKTEEELDEIIELIENERKVS